MYIEVSFVREVKKGCVVAQWLACWTANRKVQDSNPSQGRNLISAPSAPQANSAMMSTLTTPCKWKDETVSERTGHQPSYAEAERMKSLTLHSHGCPRASLRD